jgi:uncharacterized DUF497 family protein
MGKEVLYCYHGYDFTWDKQKAENNLRKHGISFEEACQAVLNLIQVVEDVSEEGEQRWAIISYPLSDRFTGPVYVVVVDAGDEAWRIISARESTSAERLRYEKEVSSY